MIAFCSTCRCDNVNPPSNGGPGLEAGPTPATASRDPQAEIQEQLPRGLRNAKEVIGISVDFQSEVAGWDVLGKGGLLPLDRNKTCNGEHEAGAPFPEACKLDASAATDQHIGEVPIPLQSEESFAAHHRKHNNMHLDEMSMRNSATGSHVAGNVRPSQISRKHSDPIDPPDLPDFDVRWETFKCTLVAFLVFGLAALLAVLLWWQKTLDEEPDCPETDDPPDCCKLCGVGTLVLPLGGEMEVRWPKEGRALLYFFGILWCFLGVSIVCDEFMASIEEITSQEKVTYKFDMNGGRHAVRRPVWNPTVANLSLMALGSSAPEILLSVIELFTNRFFAGELGPATVVGSAAFNLFMIVAVCIIAIPPDEVRRIEAIQVFGVTAFWSIVAYLWVWIVLSVITPDKVDIGEALITLFMFPVLIITAFCADKGWHPFSAKPAVMGLPGCEDQDMVMIRQEQQRISEEHNKKVNEETIRTLLYLSHRLPSQRNPKTRGQIRRSFTRALAGGKRMKADSSLTFGFQYQNHAVLECEGVARIPVVASQVPEFPVEIRYHTSDGKAEETRRYQRTEGVLTFGPNTREQYIEVPIIDNDSWDDDQEFYIELSEVLNNSVASAPNKTPPALGIQRTAVWVINDDEPGTLDFDGHQVTAEVGAKEVEVWVVRSDGTAGNISCQYETVEDTALAGEDFESETGMVMFADGESRKPLTVKLLPCTKRKGTRRFRILLTRPSPGVQFDLLSQGGEESAACEVIILGNKPKVLDCSDRCIDLRIHMWRNKIPEAFFCGGSPQEQAQASCLDWISHALALIWKVLFLLVPPPKLCGGWASFTIALVMIGGVTAIINDMASLLGCVLGLPKYVTAITLVALGTSMPDTFASRTAAIQDDIADNSIGNVTGSNSVNVFLGLGLTWTFGVLYWSVEGPTDKWKSHRYKGVAYQDGWPEYAVEGGFLQPAGSLAFSVLIFAILAFICLGLLVFRRRRYGGELGGPLFDQRRDCAILVVLWLAYLGITIPRSLEVER